MDGVHHDGSKRPRPRNRESFEVRDHRSGNRPGHRADSHPKRRRERAHPSHQRADGLCAHRTDARAAPRAQFVSEAPYGLRTLPDLYKEWTASGMIANIGARLVEAGSGTLVIEGNFTADAHRVPTRPGPNVHRAAIPTPAHRNLPTL